MFKWILTLWLCSSRLAKKDFVLHLTHHNKTQKAKDYKETLCLWWNLVEQQKKHYDHSCCFWFASQHWHSHFPCPQWSESWRILGDGRVMVLWLYEFWKFALYQTVDKGWSEPRILEARLMEHLFQTCRVVFCIVKSMRFPWHAIFHNSDEHSKEINNKIHLNAQAQTLNNRSIK